MVCSSRSSPPTDPSTQPPPPSIAPISSRHVSRQFVYACRPPVCRYRCLVSPFNPSRLVRSSLVPPTVLSFSNHPMPLLLSGCASSRLGSCCLRLSAVWWLAGVQRVVGPCMPVPVPVPSPVKTIQPTEIIIIGTSES